MTYAIPVIDLENVQLDAVRAATEELGAVQVVNHGVPGELSADLGRRMARLLALPRADKARLASPHPYRGWRQWPDDFGRLELERFNVAQFDDVAEAVGVFVYPELQTVVEPLAPVASVASSASGSDLGPVLVWDHVKDRVADYRAAYGRPEQIAAWRDGTPYVADLAENSAGR
jgi:hypothetical protein